MPPMTMPLTMKIPPPTMPAQTMRRRAPKQAQHPPQPPTTKPYPHQNMPNSIEYGTDNLKDQQLPHNLAT
eukprot:1460926-Ditylum_brightwellii.AAC.1